MKLLTKALVKFFGGLLCISLLLFLPAGTLDYPRAYLMLGVLFVPMAVIGLVLYFKAPRLLKKRLDTNEKIKAQKGAVLLFALIFLIGFTVAALDFRFAWSNVSNVCTLICTVIFLIGYGMYAEVMRENAYLSRTVKVEEKQKVVDTGLYAVVRHPMYFASLIMFLPMPLILGSFYALIPFSLYLPAIVLRIVSEEKLLCAELRGYKEYTEKVKYRIVPFIW